MTNKIKQVLVMVFALVLSLLLMTGLGALVYELSTVPQPTKRCFYDNLSREEYCREQMFWELE